MSIKNRRYGPGDGEGHDDGRWALPGSIRGNNGNGRQGQSSGRIYSQVTKSENRQTTSYERALTEGKDRLETMCRTGARVTGGNAYRSKIEYHFDKDHGFGYGRSGHVEVVDSRTVIIHK